MAQNSSYGEVASTLALEQDKLHLYQSSLNRLPTMATSKLKLQCHCGLNTYYFPVTLPLGKENTDIHICQCSDCRLQNGNLMGCFVKALSPPFDVESPPGDLTVYRSSEFVNRYFCSTCSSQLFFRYGTPELTEGENNGFWYATGALQLPPGEQFGIDYVGYIKTTPDGGFASWMPGVKFCRSAHGEVSDNEIHSLEVIALSEYGSPEKLDGRCHCSSVQLRLSRPAGKPEELPPATWSDNTDLVVPNWTPKDQQPPIDEKAPWWIRDEFEPGLGKRFLGGHCTCTSCRTISGTEVQSWLFVPTVCIEFVLADGETVPWPSREALINGDNEKLKSSIGIYKSTHGNPGVIRGFCKKCGANLFWDGLTRKNFVDLSAGLFTTRGIKEQGWIEWWTERVSYVEETEDRHEIGKLLEKGLKEWKERHCGKI